MDFRGFGNWFNGKKGAIRQLAYDDDSDDESEEDEPIQTTPTRSASASSSPSVPERPTPPPVILSTPTLAPEAEAEEPNSHNPLSSESASHLEDPVPTESPQPSSDDPLSVDSPPLPSHSDDDEVDDRAVAFTSSLSEEPASPPPLPPPAFSLDVSDRIRSDSLFSSIYTELQTLSTASSFPFSVPAISSLITDLRTREEQLLSKTTQLMSLHEEVDRMRRHIDTLTAAASSSSSRDRESSAVKKWKDLATKRKESFDELLEEGKELAGEVATLKQKIVGLATSLKEKDGLVRTLREELASANSSLLTANRSVRDASDWESERSQLMSTKTQLEVNLAETQRRLNEIESEKISMEREYREGLEMAQEEREGMREELMETITQLQMSLRARTEESFRKIGGLSRQLEILRNSTSSTAAIGGSSRSGRDSSEEVEVVSAPLLAQISDLESKAHEKESEWFRMKNLLEEEAESLRGTVGASQLRVEQLERSLKRNQDEKDRQIRRHEQTELDLRQALANLNAETTSRRRLETMVQEEMSSRRELEELVIRLKKDAELLANVRSASSTPSPPTPPAPTPPRSRTRPRPSPPTTPSRPDNVLAVQVEQLRSSRDRLSSQLVRSQKENSALRESLAKTNQLREELDEVKMRYEAAREIVAEKNLMIRDIQDDFSHAKKVFQRQVVDLLTQVERLKQQQQ